MPARKMVRLVIQERFGRYRITGSVGKNYVIYEVEPLGDGYTIDCQTVRSVLSDQEVLNMIDMYHGLENRIN
jgi:hypothetical protein